MILVNPAQSIRDPSFSQLCPRQRLFITRTGPLGPLGTQPNTTWHHQPEAVDGKLPLFSSPTQIKAAFNHDSAAGHILSHFNSRSEVTQVCSMQNDSLPISLNSCTSVCPTWGVSVSHLLPLRSSFRLGEITLEVCSAAPLVFHHHFSIFTH